ncbi:MAG: type II CAAX endopeptidase family protein [Sporolactobacillus sp.]
MKKLSEKKLKRRAIKKQIRGFGWTLNVQQLVLQLVVLAYAIGGAIAVFQSGGSQTRYNHVIDLIQANGMPMIFAVLIAFIPVLIYRQKKFFTYDLATHRRKLTVKVFLIALLIVLGVNTVLGLLRFPVEALLNLIGFTDKPSTDVLKGSDNVSMFVYGCLIAPIFEESLYRGVILRSLERFGSFFAISASALLFALMHENIIQFPYALGIGLIFGYLAKTYSIKLTILLHMANNILSEVFSDFVPNAGLWGNVLNLAFSIVPVLAAIGLIWYYRRAIRDWFRRHRPNKLVFISFFTSCPIIILVLSNILMMLLGIEKK